jgi:hypothetical protein
MNQAVRTKQFDIRAGDLDCQATDQTQARFKDAARMVADQAALE